MFKQNKSKDEEFTSIVNDILKNEKFREMDNELHHGITRYHHSIRVAKATYQCTKALKLDYKNATRAALLHDFYINDDFDRNMLPNELLKSHPLTALKNAKTYFKLNEKQENMIKSHMFPIGKTTPAYAESWILSTMDKGVAAWEMYRYKFSLVIGIWAIFMFNMLTLQK